jgi:diguanylate cyclase (GGDEF)-like protein
VTAPVVAALVVLALLLVWWTTWTARAAMSEQVIASERTAAVERAAQFADAVNLAHERLLAATGLVGARLAIEARNVDLLQSTLDQTRNRGLSRVTITDPDSQVLATSPQYQPAVILTDEDTHISAAGKGEAHITFRAPFRNAGGQVIGWLHQEQSIRSLVPRLTLDVHGSGAEASLVTDDGTVLVTGDASLGSRLVSPELLRLLGGRHSEGVRYHSDPHGQTRIAATAPVPGYPVAVVVDVDASAANQPAGALVTKLLGGFALTGTVAGALLSLLGAAVVRTRRRLQHAHEQSRRDAMTDALTGTLNRRAFDERLLRLRDSHEPVGIAIVDVDDLKSINDRHGHLAGDATIKGVADLLRGSVRTADSVFRIGGDEFAIVLTPVRPGEVDQVAARVVEAVGRRASVGAADSMVGDVDEAFRRADTAMYAAKRSVTGSC